MGYFTECRTAEELKKAYKEAAKKLHPDCGGDEEEFKKMQTEFTAMWEKLKNIHVNKDGEDYTRETEESAEEYMQTITHLMHMVGVEVELCGSWIWIMGNTKPYREELKKLGARWSRNKTCWYIHHGVYRKYGKKSYSIDEIRNMYGSRKFYQETKKCVNKSIGVR